MKISRGCGNNDETLSWVILYRQRRRQTDRQTNSQTQLNVRAMPPRLRRACVIIHGSVVDGGPVDLVSEWSSVVAHSQSINEALVNARCNMHQHRRCRFPEARCHAAKAFFQLAEIRYATRLGTQMYRVTYVDCRLLRLLLGLIKQQYDS